MQPVSRSTSTSSGKRTEGSPPASPSALTARSAISAVSRLAFACSSFTCSSSRAAVAVSSAAVAAPSLRPALNAFSRSAFSFRARRCIPRRFRAFSSLRRRSHWTRCTAGGTLGCWRPFSVRRYWIGGRPGFPVRPGWRSAHPSLTQPSSQRRAVLSDGVEVMASPLFQGCRRGRSSPSVAVPALTLRRNERPLLTVVSPSSGRATRRGRPARTAGRGRRPPPGPRPSTP